MEKIKTRVSLTTFILFTLCIQLSAAHATLGGDASTIETDRGKIGFMRGGSIALSNFKVEELVSDTTRVRQFVAPTGVVFAIAWSGHVDPQLQQLLGPYAQDYMKAEQTHPKRAGRIPYRKVNAGRVIVEYWDLLRKVQGKAYVPALMPANVKVDDIYIK